MSDSTGSNDVTLVLTLSGSPDALSDIARFTMTQVANGRVKGTAKFMINASTLTIDELLGFTGDLENSAARPRNCLRRVQISTVGDLIGKTADDLMAITNFGMKSLDYLNSCLRARGLNEVGTEPYQP